MTRDKWPTRVTASCHCQHLALDTLQLFPPRVHNRPQQIRPTQADKREGKPTQQAQPELVYGCMIHDQHDGQPNDERCNEHPEYQSIHDTLGVQQDWIKGGWS